MTIAFFGLHGTFDYHHIGGTDAIVRRLSEALVQRGHAVHLVTFGAPADGDEVVKPGLDIHVRCSFRDALALLADSADHVLSIYIPPWLRPIYAAFRHQLRQRIRFHHLYAGTSESRLKQHLLFADAWLAPYSGALFCLSPRLEARVRKWSDRAVLLLPPVPDDYFLGPDQKGTAERLRVTYMGRVDPGKGTMQAYQLFRRLQETGRFETRVCGYPWSRCPETVRLHRELLAQDDVRYEPTEFEAYSPAVDEHVRAILTETDVLFLPYQRLSSTIDTPLVMLEGMAHLCAVVTRPLGDLPWVYGHARLMFDDLTDLRTVECLLWNLAAQLPEERQRLYQHVATLGFRATLVANRFLEGLYA
jgi:glycosyltransferase involved in cell wall biosynthesis